MTVSHLLLPTCPRDLMPVVANRIAADLTFGPDFAWHPHLQHHQEPHQPSTSHGRRFSHPKLHPPQSAHHGRRDKSPQCEDSLKQVHRLLLLDSYVLPGFRYALSCLRKGEEEVELSLRTRDTRGRRLWTGSGKYNVLTHATDFWGPASNFGIPIAAIADMSKDPEM
jgi:hypothetical protein